MLLKLGGKPLYILDFDCECRPSAWYGGDWVTKELTGIAWRWVGKVPQYHSRAGVVLLGEQQQPDWTDNQRHRSDVPLMLEEFCYVYQAADMVTGHFIRGFDLPLINGALMEHGWPLLDPKLTHDTKGDLKKAQGLSKSQENLSAMLELHHPKVQMNTTKWHEANRLTPAGIKLAKKRVVGDVKQHIELRAKLLELGYLGDAKVWRSTPNQGVKYVG